MQRPEIGSESSVPFGSMMPPVLAHYMPWFQYDKVSKQAGWHWTMGRMDTLEQDDKVASHKTPLIGPYDSRDRRVIQYHLELMRLSGIKGIVVNWYGTRDAKDFSLNLEGANCIIDECIKAGMLFTVCYEDWTVSDCDWQDGSLSESSMTTACGQLQADFEYLRDRYMSQPGFLRASDGGASGQPIVLVFGPRLLKGLQEWDAMLSGVFEDDGSRPLLLWLPSDHAPGGGGCFSWFPPLTPECSLEAQHNYLADFYASEAPVKIGSIFCGYHDYYHEGSDGQQQSYGCLPEYDGLTAEVSMDRAKIHQPTFVQVCTWNDWQEGTVFEPSREQEFYYLLKLQQHILGEQDEDALRKAVLAYLDSRGDT